jgi:hypothetical protein
MPILPTSSSTGNSIQIGTNTGALLSDEAEEAAFAALGGKWEDEEERRFFEDIQDLSEIVPKSILGVEESKGIVKGVDESEAEAKKNAEDEEVKRLEEELAGLEAPSPPLPVNGKVDSLEVEEEEDDGYATFWLVSLSVMTPTCLMIAPLHRHPLLRRRVRDQIHQHLPHRVPRNYSPRCLRVYQTARTALSLIKPLSISLSSIPKLHASD